jgi:hypothetical protein
MSYTWAIFAPRIIVLLLLLVITVLDWKTQSCLRQIVQSQKQIMAQLTAQRDAALKQIREGNGDKAVVLPLPDGTTFIDRLDPGESVELPVTLTPPWEKRRPN